MLPVYTLPIEVINAAHKYVYSNPKYDVVRCATITFLDHCGKSDLANFSERYLNAMNNPSYNADLYGVNATGFTDTYMVFGQPENGMLLVSYQHGLLLLDWTTPTIKLVARGNNAYDFIKNLKG